MIRRNVLLSVFALLAIASVGLAQAPGGKAEKHLDKTCWTYADSCTPAIMAKCAEACRRCLAEYEKNAAKDSASRSLPGVYQTL